MRKTILAQDIYCANPNTEPESQSGSRVCRVVGNQAPRSTQECDLATTIGIQTLTQPLTCEMGSSIFVAMSRLKLASNNHTKLLIYYVWIILRIVLLIQCSSLIKIKYNTKQVR